MEELLKQLTDNGELETTLQKELDHISDEIAGNEESKYPFQVESLKEMIELRKFTKNIPMVRTQLLLILFIFGLFIPSAFSQDERPLWQKLRYLSEEEMKMDIKKDRQTSITDPPAGFIKNVAEYEAMQGVLIRYPLGIPVDLVAEMSKDAEVITLVANTSQKNAAINLYTQNGVNLDNCSFLEAPTNSHWTRDYGPWFIFDGDGKPGIVDFPYNRPRPADDEIPITVATHLGINLFNMDLIHTGGNYMCDGHGNGASTDLIWEENPGKTEESVARIMKDYLGIETYHVLTDPLDDYIKHIDCWGKFLSPGKVLIGQVPTTDYRYQDFEDVAEYFGSKVSPYSIPFEVYRVFTPGLNQNTPYTNSLILNDKVFVPITGNQWDDEALDAYELAMPGYQVFGILYNQWYNTDALHCRTREIADLGMLYIDHKPLLGRRTFSPETRFEADIKAFSGKGIIPDSVFVHYSINEPAFERAWMTQNDEGKWVFSLPGFTGGEEVLYYIEAFDSSGRRATHPFIGAAEPHRFIMDEWQVILDFDRDTIEFNSAEQMLAGIEWTIINQSVLPVTIDSFTYEPDPSMSFELTGGEMLPVQLQTGDSLSVLLRFLPPVPVDGIHYFDSLFVHSGSSKFPVFVRADFGLNTEHTGLDVLTVSTFPNPASDQINFRFELPKAGLVELQVFDTSGKLIHNQKGYFPTGQNHLHWSFKEHDLPGGPYHYVIRTDGNTSRGSIIIQGKE